MAGAGVAFEDQEGDGAEVDEGGSDQFGGLAAVVAQVVAAVLELDGVQALGAVQVVQTKYAEGGARAGGLGQVRAQLDRAGLDSGHELVELREQPGCGFLVVGLVAEQLRGDAVEDAGEVGFGGVGLVVECGVGGVGHGRISCFSGRCGRSHYRLSGWSVRGLVASGGATGSGADRYR